MSAQVIKSGKYQVVKDTFDDLKKMTESSGFHLLQDDNLKSWIQMCYEQFYLKMESKITIGAIFDMRLNNSSLLDALVKEDVTKSLKPNSPYLVKGDCTTNKIEIDEDVKIIKTISVPTSRWGALENSLLVLSSNNYKDFMKKIKKTIGNDPDVVVLVINSPKELSKDHIQSFLSTIGETFYDGNFFLVLNEGDQADCLSIDGCDVCLPEKMRNILAGTGIKLKNKSFKISASTYAKACNDASVNMRSSRRFSISSMFRRFSWLVKFPRKAKESQEENLPENFEKFKEALEFELNIDTVIERFYRAALKIGSSMTEIKKTFSEEKVKESINQINTKLKDHSVTVKKTIDNYGDKTNNEAVESLKAKPQNCNLIVGDVMRTFMNNKINQLKDEMKNEIKTLIDDKNDKKKEELQKFSNVVSDIYFNENLKEEEIWAAVNNYLNNDIMKCKVKDMKHENKENITESNSRWQKFTDGTKTVVADVCNKAKVAYDGLVITFKKSADKLLEDIKKQMNRAIQLLRYDCMEGFLKKCATIDLYTKKELLVNLNKSIKEIESAIREKDQIDMENNTIGNYISNLINHSVNEFNASIINDRIFSSMRSFGHDEYSTTLSIEFTGIYQDKYFPSYGVTQFSDLCCQKFFQFTETINEEGFYQYKTSKLENCGADADETKTEKFIGTSAMIAILQLLNEDIIKLIDNITDTLEMSIGMYMQDMRNLQNLQN